jgi:hypothetical protein
MDFDCFAIYQAMTDKSKCASGQSSNEEQPDLFLGILFSDEATLYVSRKVNIEIIHYWSKENPNWCSAKKEQGAERLTISISDHPLFNGIVTPESYLNVLGGCLVSALEQCGVRLRWLTQDGAPPRYELSVRHWPNELFTDRCSGLRGSVKWTPRSPNLNLVDFVAWGYIKSSTE